MLTNKGGNTVDTGSNGNLSDPSALRLAVAVML